MKCTTTPNFKIESLGVKTIDVYDIEVEDNHNFFGNDILVHNSCYINFEQLVNKYFSSITDEYKIVEFLDKISNDKLSPLINKSCEDLARYMNCPENKMSMARENIAKTAFWTAKKKYAMAVLNDEDGVSHNPPKLKIMGLETARSSTPEFIRNALKECIVLILNNDIESVRKHINEIKTDFYSRPVEDIAFPRSANNLEKWSDISTIFKKACPIAVRAALMHNKLVKELGISDIVPYVGEGDKVKFTYLKMPNISKQNVIAFIGTMPTEFNLQQYVDYDTMWQKTFIDPLTSMLNAVNWQLEETLTLDDFF